MRLVDFRLLIHNASEKGILLIFACIAALVLSNTQFSAHYNAFVNYEVNLIGAHFSVL
ncbi:MAG: Na+/H+ antiporter NhaA, partial [Alphaproteobacteria bacterium]